MSLSDFFCTFVMSCYGYRLFSNRSNKISKNIKWQKPELLGSTAYYSNNFTLLRI